MQPRKMLLKFQDVKMANRTKIILLFLVALFFSCGRDAENQFESCGFLEAKRMFNKTKDFMIEENFKFNSFDSNKVHIIDKIRTQLVNTKKDCLLDFYKKNEFESDTLFSKVLFDTYFYTSKYQKVVNVTISDSSLLRSLIIYRNEIKKKKGK